MEQTLHVTQEILEAFGLSPRNGAVRLNGGHINDTFLVEDGGQFVLQRINHYVFPSPRDIMENIAGVTAFLREKIRDRGGDPDRETLSLRSTQAGEPLFVDRDGNFWRCMAYVAGAQSFESAENAAMLREAGRAFGEFQSLLSSYPASTLHETIKDFTTPPSATASCWRPPRTTRRAGFLRWGRRWTLPPSAKRTAPC